MKPPVLLAILLLVTACSPSPPPVVKELILIDEDVALLDGARSSVEDAITKLGPADTTGVKIMACPHLSYSTVNGVFHRVASAGYERVGFAPLSPSEEHVVAPLDSGVLGRLDGTGDPHGRYQP